VLVNRFTDMGFTVASVVSAFEHVGVDHNGGRDYDLSEEKSNDVAERLFHES